MLPDHLTSHFPYPLMAHFREQLAAGVVTDLAFFLRFKLATIWRPRSQKLSRVWLETAELWSVLVAFILLVR